jgi:hypothetical protein
MVDLLSYSIVASCDRRGVFPFHAHHEQKTLKARHSSPSRRDKVSRALLF